MYIYITIYIKIQYSRVLQRSCILLTNRRWNVKVWESRENPQWPQRLTKLDVPRWKLGVWSIHWIRLRENLNRKPWFLPWNMINMEVSCKISRKPIQWSMVWPRPILGILKNHRYGYYFRIKLVQIPINAFMTKPQGLGIQSIVWTLHISTCCVQTWRQVRSSMVLKKVIMVSIPSGNLKVCELENGPLFIVDLPI